MLPTRQEAYKATHRLVSQLQSPLALTVADKRRFCCTSAPSLLAVCPSITGHSGRFSFENKILCRVAGSSNDGATWRNGEIGTRYLAAFLPILRLAGPFGRHADCHSVICDAHVRKQMNETGVFLKNSFDSAACPWCQAAHNGPKRSSWNRFSRL